MRNGGEDLVTYVTGEANSMTRSVSSSPKSAAARPPPLRTSSPHKRKLVGVAEQQTACTALAYSR